MTAIAAARECARGRAGLEAAVELLIDTGLLARGSGFVDRDGVVDFDHLVQVAPLCSAHQRAVIDLVVSLIDSEYQVSLGSTLRSLDRAYLPAVLTALQTAARSPQTVLC